MGGGIMGGMCQTASKHLQDMGSALNCSSHIGYYSTPQIVANLLHLVVQLMAFPTPTCVTEMEMQTEEEIRVDEGIQCELDRRQALKRVHIEVQTEPDVGEAETQTYAELAEVEIQTEWLCSDADIQTDEKECGEAEVQVTPQTVEISTQSLPPDTIHQEQQTVLDGMCQCCQTQELDVSHCKDCLNFLMAPSATHMMWSRLHVETENVEVQVGNTTTEIGMQAAAEMQD